MEAYGRGDVDLPVPTFLILSELKYLQDQMNSEVSISRLLNILATTPHSEAIQPIIVKNEEDHGQSARIKQKRLQLC